MAALVVGLDMCGRPSDVAWPVVPVGVDPVQRMRERWSRSHVLEELLKGRAPRLANGYAASAVVLIVRALVAVAAGKHRRPRTIFRRASHAVLGIELREHAPGALAEERSAARRAGCLIANPQMVPEDSYHVPAGAAAHPVSAALSGHVRAHFNNGQAPVCAADLVVNFRASTGAAKSRLQFPFLDFALVATRATAQHNAQPVAIGEHRPRTDYFSNHSSLYRNGHYHWSKRD